ncbi:hypothetical protein DSC45_28995 [Streptomyces sp. YIM 130001]|uniref:hypothetical protein n=1 Tax=Streptomyces sp. YIM 130001 TaxID=2259644 RepID=UPI000E64D1B4|nr:hypothetical protein [Streptomyces sp. YIM 130001]RII11329.1 hypothetical protein DSC45_28995 [Streptomyces sp. YIM 130001]
MAHVAPVAPRSRAGLGSSTWIAPVLAVVYGIWAAGIHRDAGPITWGNVLFGVVAGLAAAALYVGLRKLAPGLPRELRAAAWAAFAGIAFGFLYSLTDASILRSVTMASVVAAGVGALVFYRAYTRE